MKVTRGSRFSIGTSSGAEAGAGASAAGLSSVAAPSEPASHSTGALLMLVPQLPLLLACNARGFTANPFLTNPSALHALLVEVVVEPEAQVLSGC